MADICDDNPEACAGPAVPDPWDALNPEIDGEDGDSDGSVDPRPQPGQPQN